MHCTTSFSLRPHEPVPCFTDAARDIIRDFDKMSTQTKARMEFVALLLGLLLTVASAVKVFVFLPPRVDLLEESAKAQALKIETIEAKASATDIAIAGIVPQLTSINQGIGEIKADVRDLRNAK